MSALPNRRRGEIGGARRPDQDEPRWRHVLWRADWTWRRIVPLIALVLAIYALEGLSSKVDKTQDAVQRQVEGRKIALEVLCGGISGVESAGRRILTGTLPPPAPKRPVPDEALAQKYAEAYSRVISERVVEQAGAKAKDVLRPNGTIDCDALKRESSARAQK